jgi:5-methylthioadenosine/S-adenosylhomocysteine deaminase
MVEEMRLATLLPKGLRGDPTIVPAVEAIRLATVNGAGALFLKEKVGTLGEGSQADLIMINLDQPHLHPLHSLPAQIVYSALSSDVELVMVDGNILMEKGDLKTLDEEKILFETAKISSRLVGQ